MGKRGGAGVTRVIAGAIIVGAASLAGCSTSSDPRREANGGGGSNTAGAIAGGSSTAGAIAGGSNVGGSNTAGANVGGSNAAGAIAGGSNAAGANVGGSNTAGANVGGSIAGGPNGDGSIAGGPIAGGPIAGGPNGDGSIAGGPNGDGSIAGGSNGDGSIAGGSNGDGSIAGGSNGGGSSTATAALTGACIDDSWCWTTSLPAPGLKGVWSFSSDDLWVAGKGGLILHWDGALWSAKLSDTSADLEAIWGLSSSDMWACGADGIHHFDGTSWTLSLAAEHSFHALWGSGPGNVWAVSDAGTWRWNGSTWSLVANKGGLAISGSAANNVWIVSMSTVMHWDGAALTDSVSLPFPNIITAVWTSGPADVWIVGLVNSVSLHKLAMHWDGQSWSANNFSLFDSSGYTTLAKVWGTGPSDVWAAEPGLSTVFHWNGLSWSSLAYGAGTNGSRVTDVWAVDPVAGLIHMDSSGWTPKVQRSQTPYSIATLDPLDLPHGVALWGSGPNDVWRDGSIWNGTEWVSGSDTLMAIGGTAADNVWTASEGDPNGVVSHYGANHMISGSFPNMNASSIWGSGPNDVWLLAVSEKIVHWDGAGMMTGTLPWAVTAPRMNRIWGVASDDVWAVGEQVFHWNGQVWSVVVAGTSATYRGLWGATSNDIWAATDTGLMHWNGSTWTPDASTTGVQLRSVWGTASNDIWAGGAHIASDGTDHGGSVLHWNGSAWNTSVDSPHQPRIGEIWGASSKDVWATVPDGAMRRRVP